MEFVKDNKEFDMNDVFTALGDPLIKGLTEVASIKPKDPVAFLASFLHNFPEREKSNLGTQVSISKYFYTVLTLGMLFFFSLTLKCIVLF